MKPVKKNIIAIVLAATCLAGCGGVKWSLKDLMGPSPKEMVKMAFDPNDADRRREGITLLSDKSFGLREPYLKGYATLAKTDSNACVRSAAVRALGKAGDRKYLPVIIGALDDESNEVRWDAADTLNVMTGPKAVEPLRRHAMDDSFVDVRLACVRALGRYRRRDVVETLIGCLSDRDFSVRYEAHKSLVTLTGRDRGYDPADWRDSATLARQPTNNTKKCRRPWWDWMGLSGSSAPAKKTFVATPATSATQKAPSREKERP